MNTIRKNSRAYNYRYADMSAVHEYLEGAGLSYYQEVATDGDMDYIVTTVVRADDTSVVIRRCRGCRITPVINGKNPAQDYGSALTYARRYSLLLAFGLCTEDDDGAACATPERASTSAVNTGAVNTAVDRTVVDRTAEIGKVKRLLDGGEVSLVDIQAVVHAFGAEKMDELSDSKLARCVAKIINGCAT